MNNVEKLNQFIPGQNDFSPIFKLSQKTYGRENEIKKLEDIFNFCKKGNKSLVVINGSSGCGKTTLVNEIKATVTRNGGYFITGNFDEITRDIPYIGFIKAFNELVEYILTEPADRLNHYKNKIQEAVGDIGKVLTSLIPKLEIIIGQQAEIEKLGGQEAQNRFNYAFRNFFKAISSKENPIVLFLDDFQWANQGSVDLISKLMLSQGTNYFMLVVSQRDAISNEMSELISSFKQNNIDTQNILLNQLNENDIYNFLTDSFLSLPEQIKNLAVITYKKTGGNAFFVNQFIRSLYDENLIQFNHDRNLWTWNIDLINNQNITDNVIDLLVNKVKKLSEQAQFVVKTASSIGSEFRLETLLNAIDLPDYAIQESLTELKEEGIIYLYDETYRFIHNRIQASIYQRIPEKERQEIHYKIANNLYFGLTETQNKEAIFEAVNQYSLGIQILNDKPEEKQIIAHLNLKAAALAKESTAYLPAYQYLCTAKSLLPENSWDEEYNLTLEIYNELTEISYLKADYDSCFEFANIVLTNAKKLTHCTRIYLTILQVYTAQGKLQQAINYGLDAIEKFDFKIPRKSSTPKILGQLIRSVFLLRFKKPESFAHIKQMEKDEHLAVMNILSGVLGASFAGAPDIFPLIVLHVFNFSLKHGYAKSTPLSFLSYGLILSGFLQLYNQGLRFGKTAMELYKKYGNKTIKSEVYFCYYTFLNHWINPVKDSLPNFIQAVQSGLETGNVEFASYSAANYAHTAFHASEDLILLKNRVEEYQLFIQNAKNEYMSQYIKVAHQAILNMTDETDIPYKLEGKIYNKTQMLDLSKSTNDRSIVCHVHLLELKLCCYFGKFKQALACAEIAEKYLDGIISTPPVPVFYFYSAFAHIKCITSTSTPAEKKYHLKKFKTAVSKIKKWAKLSPQNQLHRLYCLYALYAEYNNNYNSAQQYFDKALQAVINSFYRNEEGLIFEAAGIFYKKYNIDFHAETCIKNSLKAYEKWGASTKIKQLVRNYSYILDRKSKIEQFQNINTKQDIPVQNYSITSGSVSVNLNSIVKASQTISGEIYLNKLVEKMMYIVIENAGAEKGYLFLKREDGWYIEGKADNTGNKTEKFDMLLLNSSGDEKENFSETIVHYCIRSKNNVLLYNACEEGMFINDNYIKTNKVKSVLCLPLLNQGKLVGILYFENNLISNAFTPEHVETLVILSSQMAISLENASLYENLENKVIERTRELKDALEEIKIKNIKITDSITYAKRIQNAILPEMQIFQEFFPESFILFQPRDIVSGDFYIFEKIKPVGYDYYKYITAAIDCTGHGVPGAFMSMVGNGILTQLIHIKGIYQPDRLLAELHKGINKALKQDITKNSDGMDLALCLIDPVKKSLQYSGAFNPLIYIQNNELHTIKATKHSVGGYTNDSDNAKEFELNEISFAEPTKIYLFSDGYQDQFGANDRKYTITKFKALLFNTSTYEMPKQKELLLEELVSWRKHVRQLDDIIILGIDLEKIVIQN